MRRIRVGIIDGAIENRLANAVVEARRFSGTETAGDNHGSMVAHCILDHCIEAEIISAQVFDRRRVAPVQVIVQAMEWLLTCDIDLINMSFGMRSAHPSLSEVCLSAAARCTLIAASPSHGPLTYPAAFESCLAVTGDARCQRGEVAFLGTRKCEFGTHPFLQQGHPELGGGASIATARMTGLVAEMLRSGVSASDTRRRLIDQAQHVGPERLHA